MSRATVPDSAIVSIEESIVTIVREAMLLRSQEKFVSHAGVGMERVGYSVLRAVADHSPLRLSDLAHQLGLDVSTVSRHVKALEGKGLLARSGDPTDGRAAHLELTPAGVEALDRLRAARHRLFAEILADWPQADRTTLAPLLARLAHDFLVRGGRS